MIINYICFVTILPLVFADVYNSPYGDFDLQPLLENDTILMDFIECLLDEGPCTPEGADLKSILQEVLETMCDKCTTTLKNQLQSVVIAIYENQPDAWKQLLEKYGEENKYSQKFNDSIEIKD